MSQLNIRTSKQDEQHLALLQNVWHLDRSDSTRKALEMAALLVQKEASISKEDILLHSEFIGCEPTLKVTSTNYKKKLKQILKRKHGS